MRVAALAVGEEGEEEEEEDEEEGAAEGHHRGAHGPRMRLAATTVEGKSRWPATTCPIFFVLLFLLPVWILTIDVVDASPLHPAPPHRGESRLPVFVWLVRATDVDLKFVYSIREEYF